MSDWNSDFLDLLDCLAAEGVDFLIVGAFALAQHGLPRATGDLDVLVRPTADNARRAFAALRRFGAPLAEVTAEDFARPGTVFQLGVVPRRIDLLTELSGVSFDEAWASRVQRPIDGRSAAFLGYETLIKNKRCAARPKDLVDADELEKLRRR
jgi:hypothetical protein